MKRDFSNIPVLWPAVAVICLFFAASSFYVVSPGEVAVKTRLGKIVDSSSEGLHFKLPVIENIVRFSIQIQRADIKTEAFSKDLQTMSTHLVINHRISRNTVEDVYRDLGRDYVNTVVDPMVQEIFKAIVAKYSADTIIANRALLYEELNTEVQKKLKENNILVTDISIVDLDFTDEFLKAVEAKQVAEQQAKMSEKLVEKAKKDAEQQVAKARGEAESLKMQREAVTPQLIELRKVEAEIKAIDKWNGVLPIYTGSAIPFLSINDSKLNNGK